MQANPEELGRQIKHQLTEIFLNFIAADQEYRNLCVEMLNDSESDLEKPFRACVPMYFS
jgi:hypothetical protein